MLRYSLRGILAAAMIVSACTRPGAAQSSFGRSGFLLPLGWPLASPKAPEEMTESDWSKLATRDFKTWTQEKKPPAECDCTAKTQRIGPYASYVVGWLTDVQHSYPVFKVKEDQLNLPSKPAGIARTPGEEGVRIIMPTKVIVIARPLKAVLAHFHEWRIETLIRCAGPTPSCPAPQMLTSRYGTKTSEEDRAFVESCYLPVPQSMETDHFDIEKAVEDAKGKYSGKLAPPQTDHLTPPLEDPSLTKVPIRPCAGT